MRFPSLSFSLSSSLSLSLLCSAAALAAGCVAEDGAPFADDAAAPADATALAQVASALCSPGTTAPAPDWTHYYATDPDQLRSITDYGTTGCANYVVRLVNGGRPNWEQGSIRISASGAVATTPEACVGTSLTVRRWIPPTDGGTTWSIATTTSHGEWTASGCEPPQAYSATSYWTSGIRYEASQQRSYCPNGGPYCAVQYGLPLKIKVELD